jgi:hypothetical protein
VSLRPSLRQSGAKVWASRAPITGGLFFNPPVIQIEAQLDVRRSFPQNYRPRLFPLAGGTRSGQDDGQYEGQDETEQQNCVQKATARPRKNPTSVPGRRPGARPRKNPTSVPGRRPGARPRRAGPALPPSTCAQGTRRSAPAGLSCGRSLRLPDSISMVYCGGNSHGQEQRENGG